MLLVRIKCRERSEKRKMIWSKKAKAFDWDDDEYNIDPTRCYRTSIWMGMKDVYALDYTKGISEPICYWTIDDKGERVESKSFFTVSSASSLISKIIQGLKEDWILYLSAGAMVVATIGMIVSFLIANKVGVF